MVLKKIVVKGGLGGDNDREGLKSQDKEKGTCKGAGQVLSSPAYPDKGKLIWGL